jgi:hypothetical protein
MAHSDLFSSLPDNAHCWIYAAERPLTVAEQKTLLDSLSPFFEGWVSHGRPVLGTATMLDNRFLVVAGILAQGDLSGCGIDSSVHVVEAAAQHLGVTWLSPLLVFYRDASGTVQHVARSGFRKRVAKGEVTTETPVFDLSIAALGSLRSGAFEKPAGTSWHARVFRIPEPA